MPYKPGESGNLNGRRTGNTGGEQKNWLRNFIVADMREDPDAFKAEVKELRKKDLGKLLELLIKLFPREINAKIENDYSKYTITDLRAMLKNAIVNESKIDDDQSD